MSILSRLRTQGSTLSSNNGNTPATPNFASSTLHNEYSLNGNPNMANKPSPSVLDGSTRPRYLDNLPS